MKQMILLVAVVAGIIGLSAAQAQASPADTVMRSQSYVAQNALIDAGRCTSTDPTKCAPNTGDPAVAGCQSEDCNLVQKYLNPMIQVLSILVGVAVVMGIAYGGIQYASSGGDPQKVATAKRHIRNSILALMAFFFLYAFLRWLVPGTNIITG